MKANEAIRYGQAEAVGEFVTQALREEPQHLHEHMGGLESIREAEHKGHHIVIKTIYHITVDEKPMTTHVFVDNDGTLQSHALPNYVFVSAIDMVKKIIDLFPSQFGPRNRGNQDDGHSQEHS